ncbi:hypothetical protein Bca101_059507 [Brassica carinata]
MKRRSSGVWLKGSVKLDLAFYKKRMRFRFGPMDALRERIVEGETMWMFMSPVSLQAPCGFRRCLSGW